MRSATRTILTLALAAVSVLGTMPAEAQCTHLTGTPPPSAAFILASKVLLRAAGGGLFGDGNDRFKLLKGFVPVTAPVDFTTTHSLHITVRHTDGSGPVMLAITLPPGAPWTTSGPGRFAYDDALSTLGVRRARFKDFSGELLYKVIGRDVSIANAPLTTGDTLHLMIETESGGVGDCFAATFNCTASPTVASCHS